MRFSLISLIPVAFGLSLGCSSDDGNTNTGSNNGNEPEYATNGAGQCEKAWRPTNDAFCHEECSVNSCTFASQRPVESCCVLVAEPGGNSARPLVRTTDTNDYSDPAGGAPDLSCFNQSPGAPQASEMVALAGKIKAFSNGCDLSNVKIEIYTVDNDPSSPTYRDKKDLVGTPINTDDFDVIEDENDKCPDDLAQNRAFRYENIPTYTELMVITSTADESGGSKNLLWKTLYTYNLYITTDDRDYDAATKTYTRDQRALADSDFQLIPTVAMGSTIQDGNGAVGGEVHDCDDIRLQNAMVDLNASRSIVAYFNDDEFKPLPEASRAQLGTGRTAIWSALNIPPGLTRVGAAGLVPGGEGNELVSLGYFDVRIYPDAVTSVTFRGRRPFQ